MLSGPLAVILTILILFVAAWFCFWLIDHIRFPAPAPGAPNPFPIAVILRIIVVVVFLVILLGMFGVFGPSFHPVLFR